MYADGHPHGDDGGRGAPSVLEGVAHSAWAGGGACGGGRKINPIGGVMKKWFSKIRRDERGQTATEYMLIIAVIVVAVVVIGKNVFVDKFFSSGVDKAGKTVEKWLGCDPNVNQNC